MPTERTILHELTDAIHDHPVGTVIAVAGVGYLLGGGLFTRTTRRLAGFGLRAFVMPALRQRLELMATAPVRER